MPSFPPNISTPPSSSTPPLPTLSLRPPPSNLPIIWMVLSAAVGIAVGAGTCMLMDSGSDVPVAPVVASASAQPEPEPPPAQPSLLERAERGEAEAVKRLEAKPKLERSVAEWTALEKARGAKQIGRIAELKRKIELLPAFGRSKDTKKELLGLARDSRYFIDTLEMLASLENDVGPDLIYSAWAGSRKKTDATKLAKALSYSAGVRARTSKALSVALDLRHVEDCEKLAELLKQVEDVGDRRALNPMRRFNRRTGCGDNERSDCWSCLRKGDLLRDSSSAASKRAAPL